MTKLRGGAVTVKITGPEPPRRSKPFDVSEEVIRSRLVSNSDCAWWPGSYVGHPVAFVRLDGPESGCWAYGAVAGYSMRGETAILLVLCGETSCRIELSDPPTVIKVDPLVYALQPGARSNSTALNATELLALQNRIEIACRQARSIAPAHEDGNTCNTFSPDDRITLTSPSDLRMVQVRRQHVVDCELQLNKKRERDLLADTAAPHTRLASVPTPS